MASSIEVPSDYDLEFIAALAGQPDTDKRYYSDGILFVEGVSQADMDAALAVYAHLPVEQSQTMYANNAAFEQAMSALTADYPPSEINSWERQRAEALSWDADPQAPTPWIDVAAQTREVERNVYLARTLAKVNLFADASAFLVGRRQAIDDAIRAATTSAELEAIVIDYTLPGAP